MTKDKNKAIDTNKAIDKNNGSTSINWYPGHMAKAKRRIKEDLKKADHVLIICDARAPISSFNEDFLDVFSQKPISVVLNKCDLADEMRREEIKKYFSGKEVFFTDCISKRGINELREYLKDIGKSGRIVRDGRVMIAGIPNVGKSMIINTLAKKAIAKTGNKAGVTLNQQWIKTDYGFWILDTPGILPPKLTSEERAMKLASIGCIKEEILDKEEIAVLLCSTLIKTYPELLVSRYNIEDMDKNALIALEQIGKKRGFVKKGGTIDFERTCTTFLEEFKNGKIGKVCLDGRGDGE